MAKDDTPDILPPRENAQLFGHEAAERRFMQEVARGTPHHAYLMTGPKGIGKATLAYRFARYVLSQKQAADTSTASLFGDAPAAAVTNCDMSPENPLFRRVSAGSHSDLLVLSPSIDPKKGTERGEITAEEAREVPNFLQLTPAEGDWRVVIVDAVDQLNTHAANALLKILEEPPERAIIFLICHEPGGTLATIRSRCRHFRLDAPDMEAFEKVLETAAPHIERADYPALYTLSYGSPGFAVTLDAHKALDMYDAWLAALLPQASTESKSKLADKANLMKEAKVWDIFLHSWQVALHRLTIHPLIGPPISAREAEYLDAIASAVPPELRQRWLLAGRKLITATDTFNLEKRATVRLLLEPQRLDNLMAAA